MSASSSLWDSSACTKEPPWNPMVRSGPAGWSAAGSGPPQLILTISTVRPHTVTATLTTPSPCSLSARRQLARRTPLLVAASIAMPRL